MGYLYIFGTVIFTVYGQIIIKWRISDYGELPTIPLEKILFLLKLVFDPFIFSGFMSAFVASLCWMAAMTKFELSHAYPFIGSTYVLILIASVFLFNEQATVHKIVGVSLIVLGIIISSRSV